MAHIFHSLIDTENAKRLASENIVLSLPPERISLDESLGRVLASGIISPINSPPFNRSVKDGFAVRSEDLEDTSESSPSELKVSGRILMGSPPAAKVEPGTCVYIPTGAVMPEGADAVVMVEYTHEDEGTLRVYRPVRKGENIALAGSDVPEGELIVRKGARIGPRELAVISTLGISEVEVIRKMKIGIVSTGDELIQPGEALEKGRIYESNGRAIKSIIESEGPAFDITLYGTLPDREDLIRSSLNSYSEENDILIVSGSTSAGEKDMVYRILGEYDPGIVFHGIKIKPGKPTLLSRKGDKIIIGLPGFPVSAMMTFLTIFFPQILREAGLRSEDRYIEGELAGKFSLDLGKLNLIPVSVVRRDRVIAFPIHGGSGSISRLLRADGYISVEGDTRTVEEGESVKIVLFGRSVEDSQYVVTGENDESLDRLAADNRLKVIKTGHHVALNSVLKGYADAAGIIMGSEAADLPVYAPDESGSGLAGIWKTKKDIGIVSREPVSEGASKLKSLIDRGSAIAIPGRGEGAYQMLDGLAESSGISQDEFYGLTAEVGNFNSVSYAVAEGYYVAGISNYETAEKYKLNFSPLGTYYYHVICREDRLAEMKFIERLME